jgi:hypothetical protein
LRTAIEPTIAVLNAQQVRLELSVVRDDVDLEVPRERARMLFRYFSERVRFHVSAVFVPEIWADPGMK